MNAGFRSCTSRVAVCVHVCIYVCIVYVCIVYVCIDIYAYMYMYVCITSWEDELLKGARVGDDKSTLEVSCMADLTYPGSITLTDTP